MHSGFRILLISKELRINAMWSMCVYYKPKLNSSQQASSPGHSGDLAGKGRRACNYVSGIPEYLHWKNWCETLIGGDDISTSVMMSLPLACAFQCLFTFALASTLCWLVEIWQLCRQGATGELEVEFKFQRDVVVSSPSFSRPTARVSQELPHRLVKFRLKVFLLRLILNFLSLLALTHE